MVVLVAVAMAEGETRDAGCCSKSGSIALVEAKEQALGPGTL